MSPTLLVRAEADAVGAEAMVNLIGDLHEATTTSVVFLGEDVELEAVGRVDISKDNTSTFVLIVEAKYGVEEGESSLHDGRSVGRRDREFSDCTIAILREVGAMTVGVEE